jgi:hypothetical protein
MSFPIKGALPGHTPIRHDQITSFADLSPLAILSISVMLVALFIAGIAGTIWPKRLQRAYVVSLESLKEKGIIPFALLNLAINFNRSPAAARRIRIMGIIFVIAVIAIVVLVLTGPR